MSHQKKIDGLIFQRLAVIILVFYATVILIACDGDTHKGKGFISVSDKTPGWASVSGGTTGGGSDLSEAVTVSNMDALQNAVNGNDRKIILVVPGTYEGTLEPGARTTIIGTHPGVIINGNIKISGSDKNNIIIRNLAVRDKKCSSHSECKYGTDAVHISNGAHHIWFDHVSVSDGQDGNFDVTLGADFVTCSWCLFYYSYKKEHRSSNLIAGSDDEIESRGKLNITYMNSMWGEGVLSRQPRGRFGKIHMLNNYHKNSGRLYGVGREMSIIAEGCFYDMSIWRKNDLFFAIGAGPASWKGVGNRGNAKGMNSSRDKVFNIPYSYHKIPASDAKAAITSPNCGAGNTCYLKMEIL